MDKNDNIQKIQKIVTKLHEINFGKEDGIIHINHIKDDYTIKDYFDNPNSTISHPVHKGIDGYCEACDKKTSCTSQEYIDKGFILRNISHGSHTLDFLHACKQDLTTATWNDIPVLFLMENPSINYGEENNELYRTLEKDATCNAKRPAHHWYWIHDSLETDYNNNCFDDDTFLIQRQYGKMVFSIIKQYGLGNAYLTNVVKCGISGYVNGKEKALNLGYYTDDCKRTCTDNYLKKEIQALCSYSNSILVFAFGKRTYSLAKDFLENIEIKNDNNSVINYYLSLLPHPSDYHINNTFRKYIIKGIMNETISKFETLPFRNTGEV